MIKKSKKCGISLNNETFRVQQFLDVFCNFLEGDFVNYNKDYLVGRDLKYQASMNVSEQIS